MRRSNTVPSISAVAVGSGERGSGSTPGTNKPTFGARRAATPVATTLNASTSASSSRLRILMKLSTDGARSGTARPTDPAEARMSAHRLVFFNTDLVVFNEPHAAAINNTRTKSRPSLSSSFGDNPPASSSRPGIATSARQSEIGSRSHGYSLNFS